MSGDDDRLPGAREGAAGDSETERWLEHRFAEAGRRPPLPEEELARLREAARRAWERAPGRQVGRRAWRPAWRTLAAAGVGCLALLGAWLLTGTRRDEIVLSASSAPVADVDLVTGEVEARLSPASDWERWGAAMAGRQLAAGAELRTGGGERRGRVALRWTGGASLRVDGGTALRLLGSGEVELARGALYVDAAPGAPSGLTILTPHGRFTEIGTQFEVRVDAAGAGWTRLRVREGRVAMVRDSERGIVDAGQELTLRTGAPAERATVLPFGEPWDWTLAAAPVFDIEGTSVRRFLEWATREAGWRLEFADRASEAVAGRVLLHGSIRHLTPASAPAAVLPTAGLACRVEGGVLRVTGGDALRTPK